MIGLNTAKYRLDEPDRVGVVASRLNHVQHGSSEHDEPDDHKSNRFEVTAQRPPCDGDPRAPPAVQPGMRTRSPAKRRRRTVPTRPAEPSAALWRRPPERNALEQGERRAKSPGRTSRNKKISNRAPEEPQRRCQEMHVVRKLGIGIHTFPPKCFPLTLRAGRLANAILLRLGGDLRAGAVAEVSQPLPVAHD